MQSNFTSIRELFKIIVKIAGKYKKEYLKSLFCSILAAVFEGAFLVCFYPLLASITAGNSSGAYLSLALMGIFCVCFCAFKFKGSYYDHGDTFIKVGYELRKKLGNKLMSVPLQNVHKYKTGELSAVFTASVDESVMFMNMAPTMFLQPVIIGFIVIIASFFASPVLAAIMLFTLPLAAPIYRLRRKLAVEERSEFAAANAELESQIIEYVQGIGVLKSLDKVGQNAKNLNEQIERVRQIQLKSLALSAAPTLAFNSVVTVLMCICLSIGAYLNLHGQISPAALCAALIALSSLLEPFSLLLAASSIFDLMDVAFKHVNKLLHAKDLKSSEPRGVPNEFNVEFSGVNFAYDGQNDLALKNVSFEIKPGTLNAIVGSSGSGKSTAARLLMRYADPQEGCIKIGGVNLKNIPQEELLKCLSIVFQDVYLFDDTVKNNIKTADAKASHERILEAAEAANCGEFIARLPQGLDTRVGEIGANLSGGEKQRISIARAILKNAPIAILDEPTAALDTTSELAVQKAVSELTKNKTVVVIAHRLSTVASADQILVFDAGEIVERGTHEELLEARGKYYEMWRAQQNAKIWKIKDK